jgi:Protein of unknown function (DUF3047)
MNARIAAALLWLAAPIVTTAAGDIEAPGLFSAEPPGGVPQGWVSFSFARTKRQTDYRLVKADGITVVRAEADAASSALVRRISFDPGQYPLLRWRWKVENILATADIGRRDGDDFPARLYVMFDYDINRLSLPDRAQITLARLLFGADMPAAALCYVWDNKTARGSILPSAFTDRVRLIVARSGSREVGQWVSEERDLYRDFTAAFGENPPAVSGIVIMTDTDNTGERAVAYFGDITVHSAPH